MKRDIIIGKRLPDYLIKLYESYCYKNLSISISEIPISVSHFDLEDSIFYIFNTEVNEFKLLHKLSEYVVER